MGPIGTTFFWKFLESVSHEATPLAFVQSYESTRAAAGNIGIACSPDSTMPTENSTRERVADILEYFDQKGSKTLPSFGNGITMNGETWHLRCFLTMIPHIQAYIVERSPKTEAEITYRFQLVRELVRQGVVDFGQIENNQRFGKTWDLFLFFKIRRLRQLQQPFSLLLFRDHAICSPPDRFFPQLYGKLPALSVVTCDKHGIQEFLDKCNDVLAQEVGHDELIEYLKAVPVSPKKFLRA